MSVSVTVVALALSILLNYCLALGLAILNDLRSQHSGVDAAQVRRDADRHLYYRAVKQLNADQGHRLPVRKL